MFEVFVWIKNHQRVSDMVTYKVVIRLSGLWINNLFPFLSLKPTYRTPSHDFHVNDTGATWVKFHGISSTIGNVTTTPAAATARKSGADADTNTKQIIRQIRFTNPEEIGHFYWRRSGRHKGPEIAVSLGVFASNKVWISFTICKFWQTGNEARGSCLVTC